MRKYKKELHLLANVKNIAIIHAYRPEYLKECMMNEKQSFKMFQKADHRCNLNGIFLKSVIQYFREWEDKIYTKLEEILLNDT